MREDGDGKEQPEKQCGDNLYPHLLQHLAGEVLPVPYLARTECDKPADEEEQRHPELREEIVHRAAGHLEAQGLYMREHHQYHGEAAQCVNPFYSFRCAQGRGSGWE